MLGCSSVPAACYTFPSSAMAEQILDGISTYRSGTLEPVGTVNFVNIIFRSWIGLVRRGQRTAPKAAGRSEECNTNKTSNPNKQPSNVNKTTSNAKTRPGTPKRQRQATIPTQIHKDTNTSNTKNDEQTSSSDGDGGAGTERRGGDGDGQAQARRCGENEQHSGWAGVMKVQGRGDRDLDREPGPSSLAGGTWVEAARAGE